LIIDDALGIAIFTAIFISFFNRWLLPWLAIPCMLWLIIDAYARITCKPSLKNMFSFIADVLITTAYVFLPLFVPPSPLPNVPAFLTTIIDKLTLSVPPVAIVHNVLEIIKTLSRKSCTIVL